MHLIILKSWVPFTLESNDPETILSSSYWQQQTWKKTDVNYNCISQQQSTYLTLVASKREYTRNFASIPIIIDLHAISKYLSPTLSQFFMVLINKICQNEFPNELGQYPCFSATRFTDLSPPTVTQPPPQGFVHCQPVPFSVYKSHAQ